MKAVQKDPDTLVIAAICAAICVRFACGCGGDAFTAGPMALELTEAGAESSEPEPDANAPEVDAQAPEAMQTPETGVVDAGTDAWHLFQDAQEDAPEVLTMPEASTPDAAEASAPCCESYNTPGMCSPQYPGQIEWYCNVTPECQGAKPAADCTSIGGGVVAWYCCP